MSSCVIFTDKFITQRYWIPVVFLLKDFKAQVWMASLGTLQLINMTLLLELSSPSVGEPAAMLGPEVEEGYEQYGGRKSLWIFLS